MVLLVIGKLIYATNTMAVREVRTKSYYCFIFNVLHSFDFALKRYKICLICFTFTMQCRKALP